MFASSTTENKPAWKVTVDGKDITHTLQPRLMSLQVTDNRGFEQDMVDIELDDSDGSLTLPRRGALLNVWMGFPNNIVNRGLFVIDEVDHEGPPDKLVIRGKSADFRGSMLKLREQSYHDTTLGAVLGQIASRHKLILALDSDFASEPIAHIDQQDESDAAFATRLCAQFGLVASVKSGRLLAMPSGKGKTASGRAILVRQIKRSDNDTHQFSVADRQAYSGVIAYWQDDKEAKKKTVNAKRKKPLKENKELLAGSADNVKTLRHVYQSERTAKRAAAAEWDRLQRGVATLNISLARGIPGLTAETPIVVSGWKPQIDACDWVLVRVEDVIDARGYTAQLYLEVKHDEVPEVV